MSTILRRWFAAAATVLAIALGFQRAALSDDALGAIRAEIAKRHDEGVRRLQEWIRQPSIAAENRGMTEGCELMLRLARAAGFDSLTLDSGTQRLQAHKFYFREGMAVTSFHFMKKLK